MYLKSLVEERLLALECSLYQLHPGNSQVISPNDDGLTPPAGLPDGSDSGNLSWLTDLFSMSLGVGLGIQAQELPPSIAMSTKGLFSCLVSTLL